MASQDQRQSYRAGEAKGQAQEKTNQVMGTVGNKAQEERNKAAEKAEQAKEKAWETKETAQQKAEEAAQKTKETAQYGKEKASGIMQQTGEQMKHMAQGAADAVKGTFGLGKNDDKEEETGVYYNKDSTTGTTGGTTKRSY
ncbi:late embryogenesis abundant protein 7 isoform X2 [Malus sylvestris]|uniref:late embryogenesis abundant protein 7 isoform X2 n=1 Tax=Malus sylvestris TaxID=3752 RepID=UPI0021AD28D0|nr:late embryogenesis abundant protein 7 isoform X2 [Malus sylvestris]